MNHEYKHTDLESMYPELVNQTFVFWACPNLCNGTVEWNEDHTDATCGECGRKRSDGTDKDLIDRLVRELVEFIEVVELADPGVYRDPIDSARDVIQEVRRTTDGLRR